MSTAYEQALEALELVAGTPEVRGGVFVLDQQDMDWVRKAAKALRNELLAPYRDALAFVVRDAEGGSLHDFTDYYNADQFWIRNRSRMLKPQFLFCYDTPCVLPGQREGGAS